MIKIGDQLRIITVEYALSPKTFYNRYLRELQSFFQELGSNPGGRILCMDFTNCEAIEGNVIPNLLVTGYIIKDNIGCSAQMHIQPGSKLSAFLQGINFYAINQEQKIFEITPDTSDDKDIYHLAEYCTTSVFSAKLKEEQVAVEVVRKYSRLFFEHLEDFVYLKRDSMDGRITPINIMEVFCKQICYNSIKHGKSSSYVTMQVNYFNKVVLISFADYGKGMYASFKEKILAGECSAVALTRELINLPNTRSTKLDILAILESVVYRYNSIYGIWFVLQDVMRLGGVVRIHTGKARIVFANIDVEKLESCETKESAFELLYRFCQENSDNVQETPNYMGTHVEIEIPLRK